MDLETKGDSDSKTHLQAEAALWPIDISGKELGWLCMNQGFSTSALWTFGAGKVFIVTSCPVRCKTTGLYIVDVSSTPHVPQL